MVAKVNAADSTKNKPCCKNSLAGRIGWELFTKGREHTQTLFKGAPDCCWQNGEKEYRARMRAASPLLRGTSLIST